MKNLPVFASPPMSSREETPTKATSCDFPAKTHPLTVESFPMDRDDISNNDLHSRHKSQLCAEAA